MPRSQASVSKTLPSKVNSNSSPKKQYFDLEDSELDCLFINETGVGLVFVVALKSFKDSRKLCNLIEEHLGIVKPLKEKGDHGVVLVDDESLYWYPTGVVFKASYVTDCIKEGKILNINMYRHSKWEHSPRIDYMDIFYFHKFTWDTIPEEYLLQPQEEKTTRKDRGRDEDEIADFLLEDDNSAESICSSSVRSQNPLKHSRMAFSAAEKQAIVDFIVKKRGYELLKGNLIWKKMEEQKVCPIRTWQSMKNHFHKTMIYELHRFNIPKKDLEEIKTRFFSK